MIEQNIPLLKIHKLTQEQYERQVAANAVEENAIYLTPAASSDSTYITHGVVSINQNGTPTVVLEDSYSTLYAQAILEKNIIIIADTSALGGGAGYGFLQIKNPDSLIFSLIFNDMTNWNILSIILLENIDPILSSDLILTKSQFETWWNTAENKYVDSTSEDSFLPITEGAVWESFQKFTQLYKIQCNITLSDGIITSVELGHNEGKDLSTILTEAADAYNKSRGILLVDMTKEIYLNGLMAVETLQNASSDQNSYKFIFDASHEEINVKNIIHLDANGFTCYHATLQPSLDIKNSLIKDETNPVSSGAVYSAIQDTRTYAENLANGRCKTYVFDDKATLQAWIETLDTETLEELNSGDVFLLRSVGEPDYWWEPVGEVALLAAYSDEDIVVDGKGAARILETTKVDFSILDEYAHKQNDLDGLTFKRVYEYNNGASYADGALEYDTTNKKLYRWSNGNRIEEQIDENTIYIIKEV